MTYDRQLKVIEFGPSHILAFELATFTFKMTQINSNRQDLFCQFDNEDDLILAVQSSGADYQCDYLPIKLS